MLGEVEAPSNEGDVSLMSKPPTNASPSFLLAAGFAASSLSVSSAVFMTNWVDVIKIRQQVAGPGGKNLFSTGVSVVRNEGLLALYRGVTPAVLRGMLYGGRLQFIHLSIIVRANSLS